MLSAYRSITLHESVKSSFTHCRYVLVDQAEFAEEIIQEKEKARKKALQYKRQKEAKKTGNPINYLEMDEDYEKPVKM